MPSSIGKVLGPLMTVGGAALLATPLAPLAVPLVGAGLSQTLSPSGVIGSALASNPAAPAVSANPPVAAPTGPPPIPEYATVAGGGQAFAAGGGGGMSQSQQIAQNTMASNPFATFQVS